MLGYLRSRGAGDPEDLLGEVFVQVVRDLPGFTGDDEKLRSWVFTIAHHRLMDDGRRRARRPTLPFSTDQLDATRHGLDRAAFLDVDLLGALSHLTPAQREVVTLRFVADLPLDAVAEITGRRIVAVKALQRRALRNLAKVVSPER